MHNPSTSLLRQATAPGASSPSGNNNARIRATRIWATVIALLIMLALKRHYSLASADQLDWILAPTAKLLAWFTSAHPVYERGVGYVDFSQGMIVAPACAGVNFMVMAFGLAAFCAIVRIERMAGLLIWLSGALYGAYCYTIIVNTLRISISMALYNADIYTLWLTEERVHRVAGIGIYLSALWLFYIGLQVMIDRCDLSFFRHSSKKGFMLASWIPICWYMVGAIGVPLANALFHQRTPTIGEHGITILITSACFWAVAKLLGRRIRAVR